MRKAMTLAAALAAFAAASPAAAQGWSFGVQVGPQVYYEEPPVYFGPPPVYYEPPVVYGAPVMVAPAMPRRVLRAVSPDDVFDGLEAAGYREFGTMQRRGAIYTLTAVDPSGNLVALDISILSGEIERSSVLEARYAAPPPPVPLAKPAPVARPAPVRRPAPVPAATRPARAAPPAARVTTPSEPQPAAASSGGASTLRDRLQTPPDASAPAGENKDDPLVVY